MEKIFEVQDEFERKRKQEDERHDNTVNFSKEIIEKMSKLFEEYNKGLRKDCYITRTDYADPLRGFFDIRHLNAKSYLLEKYEEFKKGIKDSAETNYNELIYQLLETSRKTFGTKNHLISDSENNNYINERINDITKNYPLYIYIKMKSKKFENQDRFKKQDIRIMNKEEFENCFNSVKEDKYLPDNYFNDINLWDNELKNTPYNGSVYPEKQKYEKKELTEKEWDEYKENHLNPNPILEKPTCLKGLINKLINYSGKKE
ncbi:MAG: hypothetical protein WC413_04175 [Candidatus Nanoarchaeia archaeon]